MVAASMCDNRGSVQPAQAGHVMVAASDHGSPNTTTSTLNRLCCMHDVSSFLVNLASKLNSILQACEFNVELAALLLLLLFCVLFDNMCINSVQAFCASV